MGDGRRSHPRKAVATCYSPVVMLLWPVAVRCCGAVAGRDCAVLLLVPCCVCAGYGRQGGSSHVVHVHCRAYRALRPPGVIDANTAAPTHSPYAEALFSPADFCSPAHKPTRVHPCWRHLSAAAPTKVSTRRRRRHPPAPARARWVRWVLAVACTPHCSVTWQAGEGGARYQTPPSYRWTYSAQRYGSSSAGPCRGASAAAPGRGTTPVPTAAAAMRPW